MTYINPAYISGIYEIFCKEIFGVKAKNLEFGLQPYKVPDTETVRLRFFLLEYFLLKMPVYITFCVVLTRFVI